MAGVPGRAQPTSSRDMAESNERPLKHVSAESLKEWIRTKAAAHLVREADKWIDEISHLRSENEELKRELMDLKERYGHAAVSKCAVRDQQNVEDITDQNRPSQIVQSYKQFVDAERMDAIEALDKEFPGENLQNEKFVCDVFQVAFEVATVAINGVRQHLPNILVNPTSLHATGKETSKDETNIEIDLKYSSSPAFRTQFRDAHVKNIMDSAISPYLKKTSDSVDTTAMEQDVLSEFKRKHSHGSGNRKLDKKLKLLTGSENTMPYIPQCCRMAWQLVVQTPSMHIQYTESVYDSTKHRLPDKKSPASESTKIYYLWPTLLNKINGKVVHRGTVSAVESRV